MKLSEQLEKVKDKYFDFEEHTGKVEYTTCHSCKHPETKYCLKCEDCGRKFKKGKLIKEVD